MLVHDYCYLICVLRLDYDLSLFNDFQIDWKHKHTENISVTKIVMSNAHF